MTTWSRDIEDLADQIVAWRVAKGFKTPITLTTEWERDAMLGKLMLVVTEVAEAAEAIRHKDYDNFREEIADTIIRLLDIAGSQGIDIHQEIAAKMDVNEKRPHKHGKETAL